MLSQLHSLNLKLFSKQYNKKIILLLIVAPQLSSAWQHKCSTKTKQASRANEQSMNSLMSWGRGYEPMSSLVKLSCPNNTIRLWLLALSHLLKSLIFLICLPIFKLLVLHQNLNRNLAILFANNSDIVAFVLKYTSILT